MSKANDPVTAEEAAEYSRLIREEGYNQRQVAERFGRHKSTVSNRLKHFGHDDALKHSGSGGVSEMPSKQFVKASVIMWYKKNNRTVTSTDLRDRVGGLPTYRVINEYWGSLNKMNKELWKDDYLATKKRTCRRCGELFDSWGPANRICGASNCHQVKYSYNTEWLGGAVLY